MSEEVREALRKMPSRTFHHLPPTTRHKVSKSLWPVMWAWWSSSSDVYKVPAATTIMTKVLAMTPVETKDMGSGNRALQTTNPSMACNTTLLGDSQTMAKPLLHYWDSKTIAKSLLH